MNLKNIKRFLALYEEYAEVRPQYELAKLRAEKAGNAPLKVPEVWELKGRVDALQEQAKNEFGIGRHYFGLIGREVKRIVEIESYWRW